jgi:quercetin dioxygenase-like cupin family protein
MREYRLTGHELVRVRQRGPELLEAELLLEPGRMPPAHRHPSQDERFHVIEGVLQVRLDGTLIDVRPGEELDIPRGIAHSMGVAGDLPVRAVWLTRPALRTEQWWAALDAASRRSAGSAIPLPVTARVLRAHQREFQLAMPRFVTAPLLVALSWLPPWGFPTPATEPPEPAAPTGDTGDARPLSQGAR